MKKNSKYSRKKRMMRYARVAVVILVLILSNIVTHEWTSRSANKAFDAEQKRIKNANVINAKNVSDDMAYSSFKLNKEKLKDIKDVMIIAHPDDETLWAGSLIEKKKYLIICLTNGDNPIRKKEFEQAMEITGNYGVMLKYPDNPNHVKNNWDKVKDEIRNDIRYVVSYKNWETITTHNPEGEYGHIQHRFTSMMVTNICVEKKLTSKLQYFGKYYTAKYLNSTYVEPCLTGTEIDEKEYIMSICYPSQIKAHQTFDHMMPYEKMIKYKNWYFGN